MERQSNRGSLRLTEISAVPTVRAKPPQIALCERTKWLLEPNIGTFRNNPSG